MQIDLINSSSYSSKLLQRYINFVIKGVKKRLPSYSSVEFSDVVFDQDLKGNRTYDYDCEWDATAWGNKVWICLSPKFEFPFVIFVNEELKGKYQNGTYIKDKEEFFIHFIAHELYHIIRYHDPKLRIAHKLLQLDEEGEADIFASAKLNEWRKLKK